MSDTELSWPSSVSCPDWAAFCSDWPTGLLFESRLDEASEVITDRLLGVQASADSSGPESVGLFERASGLRSVGVSGPLLCPGRE